jgi:hypothetical protein
MPPGPAYPSDRLPSAVVWAVSLLGLIFLGGGAYLYTTGVFRPPLDIQVMNFPATTVLGIPYRGTVLGLSAAWKKLDVELSLGNIGHGLPLVIYPDSPLKLRPIAVDGFAGFVSGFPVPKTMPPGIRSLDLPARRMVRVRVPGNGLLTGLRAFRFAQAFQNEGHYRLAEGERFEIRGQVKGQPCVEHWLPVASGTAPSDEPEETRGTGMPKSHWPLER